MKGNFCPLSTLPWWHKYLKKVITFGKSSFVAKNAVSGQKSVVWH
jgi:hypothetical protein